MNLKNLTLITLILTSSIALASHEESAPQLSPEQVQEVIRATCRGKAYIFQEVGPRYAPFMAKCQNQIEKSLYRLEYDANGNPFIVKTDISQMSRYEWASRYAGRANDLVRAWLQRKGYLRKN